MKALHVNVSLAAFPGKNHFEAMALASHASEPLLGRLSVDHVQICPQNMGLMNEELLTRLRDQYPQTRFRLHANVHVQPRRLISDFSRYHVDVAYWARLAELNRFIQAPAYSGHAGRRDEADLETMLDNVRQAQALFGCPVAVEGMYPAEGDPYLLSSWQEYETLYASDVPYALDLSHLNIVGRHEGIFLHDLVQAMLASPRCLEIHVSDNNGRRDAHQTLNAPPLWWWDLPHAHPGAVIFSEGVAPRRKEERHAHTHQ